MAGQEAVVSAGNEPAGQHGHGPAAEFADAPSNADPGVRCVMGLPGAPPVADHGVRAAGRTNANHSGGLASSVIPWDKYNHCGGEGADWIPAGNDFRLAAFAPYSITTPSGRKART